MASSATKAETIVPPPGRRPAATFTSAEKWVGADVYSPNINPSDVSDIEGEYASASEQNVRDAVTAAHEAFAKWKDSSPPQRADLLDTVGTELMTQSAEIADLLARGRQDAARGARRGGARREDL